MIKDIPAPACDTVARICEEMSKAQDRTVTQREGWLLAAKAFEKQWQQEKTEAGK